jgi:hypothetical protein
VRHLLGEFKSGERHVCETGAMQGDLIAAGKQNYDEFLNMCVWVAG